MKIRLPGAARAVQSPCIRAGLVKMLIGLTATAAQSQVSWVNPDSTYPPGASQNWTVGSNWSGGSPPSAVGVIMNNGGAALVDSATSSVTTVLLGNSTNAALSHSISIASGGSLDVTSTAATAFRLFNTDGTHRVTVDAGGALTVAGTLVNGATGGTGSSSTLTTAGTLNAGNLITAKSARTNITGGTVAVTSASGSLQVQSGGGGAAEVRQTGGTVTANNSGFLTLGEDGTYRISGGSLATSNTTQGLYINGGAGTGGRILHVDGSGASAIDFGGLRYLAAQDQASMVWRFTLDNGANHITRVNLVNSGNAGGSVRRGNLDVGLSGGVLLSGTDTLTLIEGPTISAATNFLNAADYTSGTAKLWVQSITDSTRDTLNVTLNSTVDMGTLDFNAPLALTFASSAYGYIDLANTNVAAPFTLGLAVSGGTLANFTTALTAAGVTWSAGTNGYDLNLTLNPVVSGGTVFAWDLQSIDGAMGITGIGVVPEPSTWALMAAGLVVLLAARRRARQSA